MCRFPRPPLSFCATAALTCAKPSTSSSINLDDLIATALNDPKSAGADIKAFHGINFADLNTAYHQFCKSEDVANPVVDIGQVIEFFNSAAADLPDPTRLKGRKLPSMSVVLDGKGGKFASVFEPRNRRVWISLAGVPDVVQKAFVAAEDRRFFQHHGVDEHGIIRAFIGNLADPGRPQGGSTITQQIVKNLLVGEDVTYERKIREMIVASRLESTLNKQEILELYLNSAYLGRGSWGVEMAARSYFSKSAKDLTLAEGAMLAGLLKGPSFFNPDRHPERAKERLAYVLGRMQDDGAISTEQKGRALAAPPKLVSFEMPRRDSGLHFIDFLGREAKSDGVPTLTAEPYLVHSTINASLQRAAEAALQEGLAHYEISAGRTLFRGPETNIADAIQKLSGAKSGGGTGGSPSALPAWQQALQTVGQPLSDVHWEPAVILDKGGKHGDGVIRVGLSDSRVLPLSLASAQVRRALNVNDVVYVHVIEAKPAAKLRNGPAPAAGPIPAEGQAQLRVRVERSLYTRANGFRYTAQKVVVVDRTPKVVEYEEYVIPDVTACIFFLKNRRPDRWRDVQNIEAQHGLYIISERPMTEEEWIREHCSNGKQLDLEAKAIEHDANECKSNS